MKQIFGLFALLLGVCAANAQTADTVKYAAGNDLYRGITRKLPYRQMVTPYGVEVTFAKTVHIIFPAAVRYVDLGSNHIIAGKADGAENVIRVKATTEGFPGETNFSVICEDGSFFSFSAPIIGLSKPHVPARSATSTHSPFQPCSVRLPMSPHSASRRIGSDR